MFAFPGSFYSDPFGPPPRRRARAPQPQRRAPYDHDDVYEDPYMPRRTRRVPARSPPMQEKPAAAAEEEDDDMSMFGNMDPFARMMYGMDPYEAQRRRRRAQEQERARQAKLREQKLEKRRKQLMLRGYNRAATTIQRAFRAHLKARRMAQREEAALVITRVMRALPHVKRAKKVADSLRRLRGLEKELRTLTSAYQQSPWGYRNTLWFVDQVEKVIFKLDEVPPHRSEFVRHCRKDIVQEAQRALRYADCVMRTFKNKAQVLARALKSYLRRKNAQHTDSAARVVQRVMRGVPKVQQARRVRSALRQVRGELSQLRDLRQRYIDALHSAAALADEHKDVQHASETLHSELEDLRSLVDGDLPALLGHGSSKRGKRKQQHDEDDDEQGEEERAQRHAKQHHQHPQEEGQEKAEEQEYSTPAGTTDVTEDEAEHATAQADPNPAKKRRRQRKKKGKRGGRKGKGKGQYTVRIQ